MPREKVRLCWSGYHTVAQFDIPSLLYWASDDLWVVEVRGDSKSTRGDGRHGKHPFSADEAHKECWESICFVRQVDAALWRSLVQQIDDLIGGGLYSIEDIGVSMRGLQSGSPTPDLSEDEARQIGLAVAGVLGDKWLGEGEVWSD